VTALAFGADALAARAAALGTDALTARAALALFVLGAALVLPSAALFSGSHSPRALPGSWIAYSHAAGLAPALPLAAALVFFAGYPLLIQVSAALLVLLVLGTVVRRAA
jgi:hypothetical protein